MVFVLLQLAYCIMSSRFIHVCNMPEFHSFIRLNSTIYIYILFLPIICQWTIGLFSPAFLLLWSMLLCTLPYKYLLESWLSVFLCLYLEVEFIYLILNMECIQDRNQVSISSTCSHGHNSGPGVSLSRSISGVLNSRILLVPPLFSKLYPAHWSISSWLFPATSPAPLPTFLSPSWVSWPLWRPCWALATPAWQP